MEARKSAYHRLTLSVTSGCGAVGMGLSRRVRFGAEVGESRRGRLVARGYSSSTFERDRLTPLGMFGLLHLMPSIDFVFHFVH